MKINAGWSQLFWWPDGLVVFFWSGCSCFQEFDLGWLWVGSSSTVLWFLSVTCCNGLMADDFVQF